MDIKFTLILLIAAAGILYPQGKDPVYADTTKAGVIDTVSTDTTGILSTRRSIAEKDTVNPLYQSPFYSSGTFINRREIDFLDYRYTGNLFRHFDLSFLRDYGLVGHPNELILYGTNDVSYFENGVYSNNRVSGYYNLNLMPSEMIDSIEVVPSPRGFLYGPVSGPVSVNFIKRDIYSIKPYTRIKYYEGPSGEGFIDAIFNASIFRGLIFTFDISSRKVDSSYSNSDFSIWQGEARLKYLLSDDVNITASYGYDKYDAGLNGGVNIDSISQITSNIDLLLYDELQAPVNFAYKRTNILRHNLGLRLFANPVPNSRTDLTLYYRFDKDEVSNPANRLDYPERDKNKTTGALLRQNISLAFTDLDVIAQYEKTNTKLDIPGSYMDFSTSYFTVTPVFSLNIIDSSIVPSFYYKFQNISNNVSKVYNGLGADISLNLLNHLKLYGGYSMYKSLNLSDNVNTLELSAKLNYENINLTVDVINRSESYLYVNPSLFTSGEEYYLDLGTTQAGGYFSFKVWKILLEAAAYYDLSKHKAFGSMPDRTIASPKIKLTGGIYLDGSFFDENLYLKTGFAVNYNSKQRVFNSGTEYNLADQFTTIDYTLAGEIKKAAIAYFTWENLFDETYYIVPYYPMFRRGIRFGVAWELFN